MLISIWNPKSTGNTQEAGLRPNMTEKLLTVTLRINQPTNQPSRSEIGLYRGKHYFLSFAQNIDCGYSLEPSQWCGSYVYPHSMFLVEIRKILLFFHLKIYIFTALKYCCILHWSVCVMVAKLLRLSILVVRIMANVQFLMTWLWKLTTA